MMSGSSRRVVPGVPRCLLPATHVQRDGRHVLVVTQDVEAVGSQLRQFEFQRHVERHGRALVGELHAGLAGEAGFTRREPAADADTPGPTNGAAAERDDGAHVEDEWGRRRIVWIVDGKAINDADHIGRAIWLDIDALAENRQRDVRTACHAHWCGV